MAKKDQIQIQLEKAISLGEANKKIMPSVQNWCKHLVLTDQSGGYIAAIYNLPLTVHVACPHTTRSVASMILEDTASGFIVENCINCTFHSPLASNNLGVLALKNKEEAERAHAVQLSAETTLKENLKQKIKTMGITLKPNAGITELSVLKYVEALEQEDTRNQNVSQLKEASSLKPSFFSDLALEGLCFYFDDCKIGEACMEMVNHVLDTRQHKALFILDAVLNTIRKNLHLNTGCLLLKNYVTAENIIFYAPVIKNILSQFRYERVPWDPQTRNPNYGHAINFLSSLIHTDIVEITEIFKDAILKNNTSIRINVNRVLQELYPFHPSFVKGLMPEIVASMEGEDEAIADSADYQTLLTLTLIIQENPAVDYPRIAEMVNRLSTAAQQAFADFPKIILENETFRNKYPAFCQQLVSGLVKTILAAGWRNNEGFKELEYLSYDYPNLFCDHFDAFLGYLVKLEDEEKIFNRYKKELSEKTPDQQTTFNYLIGQSFADIHLLALHLSAIKRSISDIIKNVIKTDPFQWLVPLRQLLRNLDSAANEAAKVNCIDIIRESVTDPVLMSKQLPDLYNNLLDPTSISIRIAAMKMLDNIVDCFPQVINETFLDLVDLFSVDAEPGIKANAMMILGTIAEKMPDSLTVNHINNIIKSLTDRYKYVQQKTVNLIDSIAPFINNKQRDEIFNSLVVLEEAYAANKEWDFCAKVVWQLSDLSENFPGAYRWVVRNYIIKYCNIEDANIRKDFFKHLTTIKSKHPEFEEEWLKQATFILTQTRSAFYDNRERSSVFSNMYTISTQVIRNNVSLFKALMDSRDPSQDAFDIVNILSILAWFELHELLMSLAEKQLLNIPVNAANKNLRGHCMLLLNFSKFITESSKGILQDSLFQEIKNGIQAL